MWVLDPPALFLWPEQPLPAGPGLFPDSLLPKQAQSPDWGLLALSRRAGYYPQLRPLLPFCPEQSRRFRRPQAVEKKELDLAPEQRSRCWAGCCSDCRRRAFSLLLCGWPPPFVFTVRAAWFEIGRASCRERVYQLV